MILKNASPHQLQAILDLNESEVPRVGSISFNQLMHLAATANYFRVAETDAGELAGFLLAFDEKADYTSPNYLWFRERHPVFEYVDRIVIAKSFRGQGVGRKLYEDIASEFQGKAPVLTCEVNLEPPNPESAVFHQKLGFAQVGTQATEGGKKTVSLLLKKLSSPEEQ